MPERPALNLALEVAHEAVVDRSVLPAPAGGFSALRLRPEKESAEASRLFRSGISPK